MSKRPSLEEGKPEFRLLKLMEQRRWCYVIPESGYVQGMGYRVSIVVENEPGHFPTGSLETLAHERKVRAQAFANNKTVPWFWGETLEEARATCDRMNEKIGISPLEAVKIVASTMGGMVETPAAYNRKVGASSVEIERQEKAREKRKADLADHNTEPRRRR